MFWVGRLLRGVWAFCLGWIRLGLIERVRKWNKGCDFGIDESTDIRNFSIERCLCYIFLGDSVIGF